MNPRYQTSNVQTRPSTTTNPPRALLPVPNSQPTGSGQQQAQQSSTTQNQSSANLKNESSQISNVDQEKVNILKTKMDKNYFTKLITINIFFFLKAALIMQVLQLTEEQIAMLPPEQRQSILMLKEQIAQSAGGLMP